MTNLGVLSRATAPEAAKATFDGLQKKMGFVPNLYAPFAHSPRALNAPLPGPKLCVRAY